MTDLHALPNPPAGPVVIGLDTAIGSMDSTGTGIASSNGWCEAVGYPDRRDKKRPFSNLPHSERLLALIQLASHIALNIGKPDLVVLELPAPSRAGGGSHERAWLWWEMYRRLTLADIPIGLMTPNHRMQYATGKGSASKSAVVDAVARRWPAWQTAGDDNLADAVVLMAAGRDWLGHPLAPVPQTHRVAVTKATWPELTATGVAAA
jgi:crossover junction endodeoxyribonuclease RuvC